MKPSVTAKLTAIGPVTPTTSFISFSSPALNFWQSCTVKGALSAALYLHKPSWKFIILINEGFKTYRAIELDAACWKEHSKVWRVIWLVVEISNCQSMSSANKFLYFTIFSQFFFLDGWWDHINIGSYLEIFSIFFVSFSQLKTNYSVLNIFAP